VHERQRSGRGAVGRERSAGGLTFSATILTFDEAAGRLNFSFCTDLAVTYTP
jgi:hypothetical protein